jgi:pimeloyl-ACP methyl ester carboxylesterase
MATFVLVHGSAQSARAWDLVKPELERQRHTVITPELPADEPEASATRFAEVIATSIPQASIPQASIPHDADPIVVAHSAAGWFLPLAASLRRVRRMVFLAAAVPRIGMGFMELFRAEPEMINPAWLGKDPRIESVADEFLFHDCPPERLSWAHETVRIVNLQQAVVERYPLQRWPDVPASYIVCADDRTISPEWSRKIARSQLGVEPIELPGGHCPNVSRPIELAEVLIQLSDL